MSHFKRPGQAVLASFLTALVLLLAAMATCPELHQLIHHDADEPGHECAVTMFLHGQVDSVVVAVAASLPIGPIELPPVRVTSVFSAPREMLPPGRGPPSSFLPS